MYIVYYVKGVLHRLVTCTEFKYLPGAVGLEGTEHLLQFLLHPRENGHSQNSQKSSVRHLGQFHEQKKSSSQLRKHYRLRALRGGRSSSFYKHSILLACRADDPGRGQEEGEASVGSHRLARVHQLT